MADLSSQTVRCLRRCSRGRTRRRLRPLRPQPVFGDGRHRLSRPATARNVRDVRDQNTQVRPFSWSCARDLARRTAVAVRNTIDCGRPEQRATLASARHSTRAIVGAPGCIPEIFPALTRRCRRPRPAHGPERAIAECIARAQKTSSSGRSTRGSPCPERQRCRVGANRIARRAVAAGVAHVNLAVRRQRAQAGSTCRSVSVDRCASRSAIAGAAKRGRAGRDHRRYSAPLVSPLTSCAVSCPGTSVAPQQWTAEAADVDERGL